MFPPASWKDIDGYEPSEMVAGYLSYERGDPTPGQNHSDGFRWGWQNHYRDSAAEDDGFDRIRREYIRESRKVRAA